MEVSNVSFSSAYISNAAKQVLGKAQKDAIYKLGYSQKHAHITAKISDKFKGTELEYPAILFKVSDKASKKELGQTYARFTATPEIITKKIKRLLTTAAQTQKK